MAPPKEGFSKRELELLAIAMQSIESPPKINYKKFAELAGFKKAHSASCAWSALKNKLLAKVPATPTKSAKTAGTPSSTGKKSTGRKRQAAGFEEDDETPTKKLRTKNMQAPMAACDMKLEDDDEDDDEGLVIKYEEGVKHEDDEGLVITYEQGVKHEED